MAENSSYATFKIYADLYLNTITGNAGSGAVIYANTPVSALYNDINANTVNGLDINTDTVNGSNVNYNNLYNNSGSYDLANRNTPSINGQYNFWGAATTTEMETEPFPAEIGQILDLQDGGAYGPVDYTNWLGSAVILPATLASEIIFPVHNNEFKAAEVTIKGIAVSKNGIDRVEVSPDNGSNWYEATGKEIWSYTWTVPSLPPSGIQSFTLLSRVIDLGSTIEIPGSGTVITINNNLPTTSGSLTENETWSSIVNITGDVIVPAGVTLTIDPGTQVRFNALGDDQGGGSNVDRAELIIHGSLSAVGTSGSSIDFASSSASPAAGDWHGIRAFSDGTAQSITLSWCTISHAELGLDVRPNNTSTTSVNVTNTTIQEITGIGLYVHTDNGSSATITLDNNTLSNIGTTGIYAFADHSGSSLTGTISYNQITSPGGHGIVFYANNTGQISGLTMDHNTITNAGSYGIYGL
ncbi:MAG: hypothetical protein GY695_18995, partial [Aestuariibacter sp.]|nr:hypothetical protein [Aestuariibacter sp.]